MPERHLDSSAQARVAMEHGTKTGECAEAASLELYCHMYNALCCSPLPTPKTIDACLIGTSSPASRSPPSSSDPQHRGDDHVRVRHRSQDQHISSCTRCRIHHIARRVDCAITMWSCQYERSQMNARVLPQLARLTTAHLTW